MGMESVVDRRCGRGAAAGALHHEQARRARAHRMPAPRDRSTPGTTTSTFRLSCQVRWCPTSSSPQAVSAKAMSRPPNLSAMPCSTSRPARWILSKPRESSSNRPPKGGSTYSPSPTMSARRWSNARMSLPHNAPRNYGQAVGSTRHAMNGRSAPGPRRRRARRIVRNHPADAATRTGRRTRRPSKRTASRRRCPTWRPSRTATHRDRRGPIPLRIYRPHLQIGQRRAGVLPRRRHGHGLQSVLRSRSPVPWRPVQTPP